jgi:hypothetical protein
MICLLTEPDPTPVAAEMRLFLCDTNALKSVFLAKTASALVSPENTATQRGMFGYGYAVLGSLSHSRPGARRTVQRRDSSLPL